MRFIAEAPERTRVELEHRSLDRHGAGWEAVREGVDGAPGWPLYLHSVNRQAKPASNRSNDADEFGPAGGSYSMTAAATKRSSRTTTREDCYARADSALRDPCG